MSAPDFITLQLAFAAHLRDPDHHPAPEGIEPRRVRVYRDLIYNNVRAFMHKGFPVLVKVLGATRFDSLVRTWLAEHRAATPLFPRMPGEFVSWLQGTPTHSVEFPPWLCELAHYEWVELELSLAEDAHLPKGERLQVSPLARVLSYEWPVHLVGPDSIPDIPQQTSLLVYRDERDTVRFLETTPMTHVLLNSIQEQGPMTVVELLSTLDGGDALMAPAQALLDELLVRGVIRRVL